MIICCTPAPLATCRKVRRELRNRSLLAKVYYRAAKPMVEFHVPNTMKGDEALALMRELAGVAREVPSLYIA